MSRSAVDWRSANKNNYTLFRERHPEIDVTFDEWKNVIYSFMELYKETILETGYKTRLPAGIGEFAISKGKSKKIKIDYKGKEHVNLPIDWSRTKEKSKYIYNFNYHTEGYVFKWKWFKNSANFKLKALWYFKPSRITARLLAHYLKVDDKYQHIYMEWRK